MRKRIFKDGPTGVGAPSGRRGLQGDKEGALRGARQGEAPPALLGLPGWRPPSQAPGPGRAASLDGPGAEVWAVGET